MFRTSPARLARLALVLIVVVPLVSAVAEDKATLTADEALQHLKDGNQRFVDGKTKNPNSDAARRTETAKEGQHPFVTILGCSDSRVPLERVFDYGIGDLFVVRVAGNVAGSDELGSIEYAAGHLHTPLLVVLGHTKCGAVGAAVEKAPVAGFLKPLVALIAPAVERAHEKTPQAAGDALVVAAIKENVWQSIADTLTKSAEVRELVETGKLKVVGALYNVETGQVEWLGPHPEQDRLLHAEKKEEAKGAPAKAGAKP